MFDDNIDNKNVGIDRHRRNVGVLSIATYFPKTFVSQEDLEAYDQVPSGKYTKGLMQEKMAFCTDLEDINSISLTVLKRLIEQSGVNLTDIGYLEVGTETIVDKSKSVKTVLMELFEESGNTDIEGVDTTNACYGGTAALFHAIDHCSTPHWDGRLAVVIAADIAVYDKGNARPTGGCGAVAMLIGPNAPLVFDPIRASHMSHTYDFYKPDPYSEYPTVDGKLSLHAYISALDKCYDSYRAKYMKMINATPEQQKTTSIIDQFNAILMHSPYCKLVRKSFARLLYNEYIATNHNSIDQVSQIANNNNISKLDNSRYKGLEEFAGMPSQESIDNRDLEKITIELSEPLYQQKTLPSLLLSNQIGNMYTASLYSCLVAYLVSRPIEELAGKPILFFSYGSGLAASMFSARVSSDLLAVGKLVVGVKDVHSMLQQRIQCTPEEFTAHLEHRKQTFSLANREPTGQPTASGDSNKDKVGTICIDQYLFPGTYYLTSVDKMYRRKYSRLDSINESNNNNEIGTVVMSKNVAKCTSLQQQDQQQQSQQLIK